MKPTSLGTFSRINASPIGTDLEHTIRCSWGDYDNDGFLDLFVRNFAGANFLYLTTTRTRIIGSSFG